MMDEPNFKYDKPGRPLDTDTGYYGETPNTYNLTVTATSGNLSRSVYLTLTVQ